MGSLSKIGLVALLACSPLYGCDEEEPTGNREEPLEEEEWDDEDDDWLDDEPGSDAGSAQGGSTPSADAGGPPAPSSDAGRSAPSSDSGSSAPQTPAQSGRRTEVPAELVGTWTHSYIDFALWENYRQGQWSGRNSVNMREAMILRKDGDAKYYRFEQLFPFYEELIDCEGTVAFHGDGTFTFYPSKGRKRFLDATHSERNADRALTAEELLEPKLAGTRAYIYVPDASPPTVQIKVPSSAAYNWYKQE